MSAAIEKVCTVPGCLLPLHANGLCQSHRNKKYYQDNKVRILAQQQSYYRTHHARILARKVAYRRRNAPILAEKHRVYKMVHRDAIRLRQRQWYRQAPRRIRPPLSDAQRARRRLLQRARRAGQREHIRALDRQWKKAHPDAQRAHKKRRRAAQRHAPLNDLTAAQWEEILVAFKYRCAYCHCKLQRSPNKIAQRITQDHLTPLGLAGSHTVHNVVPACLSCNSRKGKNAVLAPVQPLLLTIA